MRNLLTRVVISKAPEHEEVMIATRLAAEQVPRQRTAHGQPGYRVTFHTSARPMAGTNSQVHAWTHPNTSIV